MRGPVVIVAALALASLCSCVACDRGATPHRRTVFFAGDAVASVDESVDGANVTRVVNLGDERITTRARVDDKGFVLSASYDRPGKRHLRFESGSIKDDLGHSLRLRDVVDADGPVVLIELVQRLRVTAPTKAVLVDLSSAEAVAVSISRRGPEIVVVDEHGAVVVRALPEGQRTGPGAFVEGDAANAGSDPVIIAMPGVRSVASSRLGGEASKVPLPSTLVPSPSLSQPSLFVESDDDAVRAFSGCAEGRHDDARALDDARRVAEAAHALVDAGKGAEPPSAVHMLAHGGDCDGAAALVAAALRACGHAARPVVGYKLVDAGTATARLVPHAVVEVYAGSSWTKVDATVPAIGSLDAVFLPVAEGLGGALTMGRVLGRVDSADVVDAGRR